MTGPIEAPKATHTRRAAIFSSILLAMRHPRPTEALPATSISSAADASPQPGLTFETVYFDGENTLEVFREGEEICAKLLERGGPFCTSPTTNETPVYSIIQGEGEESSSTIVVVLDRESRIGTIGVETNNKITMEIPALAGGSVGTTIVYSKPEGDFPVRGYAEDKSGGTLINFPIPQPG